MKRRTRRWPLLAAVAMAMVVMALVTFSSSSWATPAQKQARQQSVPPFKTSGKATVYPGAQLVFEVHFTNAEDLTNAVITDDLDPYLTIDNVTASPGADDVDVTGQTVTVTYNSLVAGTTVTITIYCTVRDTAPVGWEIVNAATLTVEDPDLEEVTPEITVTVEPPFVPETGSMLLLTSGLAGVAGYAALRWRARRKQPR